MHSARPAGAIALLLWADLPFKDRDGGHRSRPSYVAMTRGRGHPGDAAFPQARPMSRSSTTRWEPCLRSGKARADLPKVSLIATRLSPGHNFAFDVVKRGWRSVASALRLAAGHFALFMARPHRHQDTRKVPQAQPSREGSNPMPVAHGEPGTGRRSS